MALHLEDVLWSMFYHSQVLLCRSKFGRSTLTVSLWQKLKKTGRAGQPLKLLQCLYSDITSTVRE